MIGNLPYENIKKDDGGKDSITMVATLIEAIIGAVYLAEFQEKGTSDEARNFIKTRIIG